jgi:inorganic triphosphatase YgiF
MVDDAIYAIFSSCIKHWKGNESAVVRGRSAEAIHQMRVTLRRMRTALADFRDIIPDAQLGWLKKESKWLVTSLGPACDWNVFLVELLAPVGAARRNDINFAVAERAAEAKRKHGYERPWPAGPEHCNPRWPVDGTESDLAAVADRWIQNRADLSSTSLPVVAEQSPRALVLQLMRLRYVAFGTCSIYQGVCIGLPVGH